jgi:hypothetical protein
MNIKSGDILCFHRWVKVNRAGNEEINVTSVDHGNTFDIRGESLIASGMSGDSFSETLRVSKTDAAKILSESVDRPFTVVFKKADGSLRTLRGRLIPSADSILGRSMVEDLDLKDNRVRQVDHRTIVSLIVDNTKFVVK